MIISGPLCYLLFRSNNNILFGLIPLLFIYIIYEYIINILFIGKKNNGCVATSEIAQKMCLH